MLHPTANKILSYMNIRKTLLSAILILTFAFAHTNPAQAQSSNNINKDFGLGAMLGEPTGVSVKVWTGNTTAIDVGAAWSLSGRNEALHLHSDLLFHSWFPDTENLAFYYGIGGRIIFADEAKAGVRAPLGLTYVFDDIPFDLFVEAVPILDLTPDTDFAGNGAVGIRYYF